jgi:hypothetical protein
MKVTVLPIKRFALMKSDVFIDVIKHIYKGNRMASTSNEFIQRIICAGFLVTALGVVTLKKKNIYIYRVELFTEAVDLGSTTRCSYKYLELKNFEVEVFRVEV